MGRIKFKPAFYVSKLEGTVSELNHDEEEAAAESGEEEDAVESAWTGPALARAWISYAFGTVLGRYAIGGIDALDRRGDPCGRPVDWPLQSPKRKFTVWMFQERFTRDTLFKVRSQFADQKSRRLESRIRELKEKDATRSEK
jgi:hypothetical protein